MMINFARYRFKGTYSRNTLAIMVAQRDNIDNIEGLELDHIIPFCISSDNSLENLQLLTKKIHSKKSGRDRKILKRLREEGYYERITHYSLELLKPQKDVVNRFVSIVNRLIKKNKRKLTDSPIGHKKDLPVHLDHLDQVAL